MQQSRSQPWPHIRGLQSVLRRGGDVVYSPYYGVAVSQSGKPNLRVLVCSWLSYDLTRTQFRRQANAADNKAATVAVDSLLNYEAVKVCVQFLRRR